MRVARTALAVPALALALTACGGDGTDDAAAPSPPPSSSPSSSPSSVEASPTSPAGDAPAGTAGSGGAAAGRPAEGTCADIPEAADGRYTVADAGTIVVTREGDRLVLGEIAPAEGWTHHVDDHDDDEIEVEFRHDNGDELDFEIEIDDGRVEVEICADDD